MLVLPELLPEEGQENLALYTLLLETEEFPRSKPCGGGLSDHAISYFDFEFPQDIIKWEVTGTRISFRGQVVEAHKDHCLYTMISRDVFDNLLLEKAIEGGAEAHIGEQIFQCEEFLVCGSHDRKRNLSGKVCHYR